MKTTTVLALSAPLLAAAAPAPYPDGFFSTLQSLVSQTSRFTDLAGSLFSAPFELQSSKPKLPIVELPSKTWTDLSGKEFVTQNGVDYERVTLPSFSDYALRFKEPKLCDPSVKQYSGYLDVDEEKHLFFWFFEARNSPKDAPLVLWLNGGPGCSSSTGLLFELGPCSIAKGGEGTDYNPHSWNSHANIIFLDQPINVGYSYSSDSSTVSTSPAAAVDVHAFLQLFLARFPAYAKLPFHVAAESYGGTYAPNIAAVIHKHNKKRLALEKAVSINAVETTLLQDSRHINLASVILANGMTDPYTQFASAPEYACSGPFPIFEEGSPECQALRSKVPTCQRLVQTCYRFDSRFTCVPAGLYCWSQLYGSFQQLGLNPYDVRKKCNRAEDGDLCYKQMNWIDVYLNKKEVKKELGVNPEREFASCNMEVNRAFMAAGDGMHNSAALLPELLADGVRLLVYAGNADFMCNYMGNRDWMEALPSVFQKQFNEATLSPWVTLTDGVIAGEVKSVGGGDFSAGNFTYVSVNNAGHMVPYDQPEAALDLFVRWITDTPLHLNQEELTAQALKVHPFGSPDA